jgi:hypothetical protein
MVLQLLLTTVQLKEEHAVTLGRLAWFESSPHGSLFSAKPNVGELQSAPPQARAHSRSCAQPHYGSST